MNDYERMRHAESLAHVGELMVKPYPNRAATRIDRM
jgi:hypothetical protein